MMSVTMQPVSNVTIQQIKAKLPPPKPNSTASQPNSSPASPKNEGTPSSPTTSKKTNPNKAGLYTYEVASQAFNQAKTEAQKNKSDAYKQYMLNGTDFKVESVKTGTGSLTRFETGTILKESKANEPITISSPSGLVIQSDIITKPDVEEEMAKIDKSVDALNLKKTPKEIHQMSEDQLTHNLAESEIWGITMSDPDRVSINPETEEIDVDTPTGKFHLDKQDNIEFERADNIPAIELKPALPSEQQATVNSPKAKSV